MIRAKEFDAILLDAALFDIPESSLDKLQGAQANAEL